jgi:hypothetical protein
MEKKTQEELLFEDFLDKFEFKIIDGKPYATIAVTKENDFPVNDLFKFIKKGLEEVKENKYLTNKKKKGTI